MRIANPIYDVVFKYLMDDNKIAKLMISKIIGEEIESLDFTPTEQVSNIGTAKREKKEVSFTVYRLDFSAKIITPTGERKQVLIEIQKAKYPIDIMRFRKYLGQQYSSENNTYLETAEGKPRKHAMPIVSIYFLGHWLDKLTAPVIKVNRTYTDLATQEVLSTKVEFIESLTHNSFVIQIPALKGRRRNELEQLLSVFDQSQKESDHILNLKEEDFPEQYRNIIRKLNMAIADEQVVKTMSVEDEVLAELAEKERAIENLAEKVSKKDKTLKEKDQAFEAKDLEIERLRKLLGK